MYDTYSFLTFTVLPVYFIKKFTMHFNFIDPHHIQFRRRTTTLLGYTGYPHGQWYTLSQCVQDTYTHGPIPQLGLQSPSGTQEVGHNLNPTEKNWSSYLRSIWLERRGDKTRQIGIDGEQLQTLGLHHPRQTPTQLHHHPTVWCPFTLSLYTLYITEVLQRLQRVFKSHGISSYHKPFNTYAYCWLIPRTDKSKQCGLVYSLWCEQCKAQYIGKTVWTLWGRYKEHADGKQSNSAICMICQHMLETGHCSPFTKWRPCVARTATNAGCRRPYIHCYCPTLNHDRGYEISVPNLSLLSHDQLGRQQWHHYVVSDQDP